jgi:mRNA interferase HicA
MKGSEFLRKLKALADRRGWDYAWQADRGKGSHGTAYLNGKKTIVRSLKDELKTGTFHAMVKQLGLEARDLYE